MWFGSNENLQRMDRELHFQSNLSRAGILERLRLDPTHGGHNLFQSLVECEQCTHRLIGIGKLLSTCYHT